MSDEKYNADASEYRSKASRGSVAGNNAGSSHNRKLINPMYSEKYSSDEQTRCLWINLSLLRSVETDKALKDILASKKTVTCSRSVVKHKTYFVSLKTDKDALELKESLLESELKLFDSSSSSSSISSTSPNRLPSDSSNPERDLPSIRYAIPSRHLWIGNITDEHSEEDLQDYFALYGELDSVRILHEKKCAFANFQKDDDCLNCVEEMDKKHHHSKKRDSDEKSEQNLIVNFQWSFDAPVSNGNARTGKSRTSSNGTSPGHRAGWMNESGGLDGGGGTGDGMLAPNYYFSYQKLAEFQNPSRQLFVGNLSPSMTVDGLTEIFSHFGPIEYVKDFIDRGFAFVLFVHLNSAIWARTNFWYYPLVVDNRLLAVNYGRIIDEELGAARISYEDGEGGVEGENPDGGEVEGEEAAARSEEAGRSEGDDANGDDANGDANHDHDQDQEDGDGEDE